MKPLPFWPNPANSGVIDLKLPRVLDLLSRLDNPHLKLPPVIHIAGTNGKGSTLSFLRAIFEKKKLRVHSYTSPHLVEINERIVLAGKKISDPFLNECLKKCKEAAEQKPEIPVTFFEGITVAAFLAFSLVEADILLLEVGMGGRLDATNILPEVLCSVITPVSLDHEKFLGDTLGKIAFEKAGILKKNCPAVIAKQEKESLAAIAKQALATQSHLTIFGKDWKIKKLKKVFVFEGFGKKFSLPMPSLIGDHQIENASVAVAIALTQKKFSFTEKQIADGIQSAVWPARLQKITSGKLFKKLPQNCELYLDGSHNQQGALTVEKFLKDQKKKEIFVVFGMLQDKDCGVFLKIISKQVDHLLALEIPHEFKARSALEIKNIAQENGIDATAVQNIEEAFFKILEMKKGGREAVVLICGSLYLAGEFLRRNTI